MPAMILSYNETTCTAKIQPLFKVKEVGKEPVSLPAIEGVPVLKQNSVLMVALYKLTLLFILKEK